MRVFAPYDRRNGARASRAPTPGGGGPAVGHARAVIAALLGVPAERGFDVRYWDGTIERGRVVPPPYTLIVARPGALRRMLLPPNELRIAEAYLAGDVDIDGSLEHAVTIADAIGTRLRSVRTLARVARHLLALPADDRAQDVRRAAATPAVTAQGHEHGPARDAAAIRYHYDVGNDFYALWLDRRMVYSCAYFRSPADSLDDAQLAKVDLVCRKLRLRPGERFLDVGCGWGALIMHAAEHYGVHATGITLSAEQAALARARIAAAGLADRCRVELRDYRALGTGDGADGGSPLFDKIASVGMIEHVGVARLGDYFDALHRVLAPGGLLLNHGIVRVAGTIPTTWRARLEHRLWRRNAFIERYVFPDGELGPLHAVIAAAERSGFETRDAESLREHYVLTLRAWLARLDAREAAAIAATDERTVRTWRLYMSGAAHGFASGRLNVVQTLLAKPVLGRAGLPMTREDLYVRRQSPARTPSEAG